jgi:signal transduction histidine kinase
MADGRARSDGPATSDSRRRLRILATDYRTRLLLAILFVVAVALSLVLVSLPRLLEGYLVDQERQALESRASTVALLVADRLDQAARAENRRPLILSETSATDTTRVALGEFGDDFIADLAAGVALADVSVALAPAEGAEPIYRRDVLLPDEEVGPNQRREEIDASASATVRDVWLAANPESAPLREVSVTLSRPLTSRQQTTQTITEVLLTAALIALIFALVTALLLAQWLTRPLRRLTQASRQLAEGHLEARVDVPDNAAPEVVELSSAFNDMADRLQESVAIISEDRDRGREFLADVSHELRTPIAALRTFNELLLEGAGDDPATRDEFLRQSRSQVERLDWLAANLLELSRLDSGLIALDLREDDLRAIAESAVEHAEPLAAKKGVVLELDVPREPLVQPHDPPRLGQVLGNLVGNAVKFTPAGGHVRVGLEATGEGARFTVRDDGVGIDPEELEHVFDRFYRGSRGPEERAAGSGLGLAIVRSIVDMHDGRVEISSSPDVGTVVSVDLPRDGSTDEASDVKRSSPRVAPA